MSTDISGQLIDVCRDAFGRGRRKDIFPNISPQLATLREDSRRRWRITLTAMRRLSCHRKSNLRRMYQDWLSLRLVLDVDRFAQSDDESDGHHEHAFAPLTMCNWKDCMCSVHEPIHPLKICKRCQRVAYCNSRCQSKYVYSPGS